MSQGCLFTSLIEVNPSLREAPPLGPNAQDVIF